MKIFRNLLLLLLGVALTQHSNAQAPSISYSASISKLTLGSSYSFSPVNVGGTVPATHYGQVAIFVGSPTEAVGYTNATGTVAQFSYPQQMTMDASGNLYLADAANNAIRETTPAGVTTTFAGDLTGLYGSTNGTGTSALFNYPDGLAIDASGNLYVSDYNNNQIREISPSAVVTTFYDSGGATFGPGGLCFDNTGNLIVAAQDASQIISISPAGVATVIDGNSPGYYNATGTSAQFNTPTDVRVDAAGNTYVVDFENNAIRKITPAGVVTTIAGSNVNGNTPGFANGIGTAAVFNNPTGLVIGPGGAIYIADFYNNDIRRIMPDGTVSLVAGSSAQVPGDSDGLGTAAGFNQPDYMYIDGTGTGYIAEFAAERIRKITLTGYTLQGTLPAGLSFDGTTGIISGTPTSVTTSGADTIIAWNGSGSSSVIINFHIIPPPPSITYDLVDNVLTSGSPYTLDPVNSGGAVPATDYAETAILAGSTSAASGYTNGTGTAARFNQLTSSVMDAAGNLYVSDGVNNAIRKITPAGVVSTFAGSSTGTSGSTDATGTSALFYNPQGLAIDGSGNLIVSDNGNNSIRKIDPYGVVTTFYHSTSTFGPAGLTVDNSNDVIVAAKDANQIWKITPTGAQSVIAGSTSGYNNATGVSAQFNNPTDVKIDASSNLFVADNANNAIREIDPSGAVTTFAGSNVNGNTGGFLDGVGTAAIFNSPAGLFLTPGGVMYVAESANNDIRRILADGTVTLVAGSSSQTAGNADGTGTSASFNQPGTIFIDNTATAYVTELAGNAVKKVTLTGYSLAGTLPTGLSFDSPSGEISGTVSGTVTPTQVTVTAYNAGGYSLISPLVGGTTNNWTGVTSIDWGTGTNWSAGHAPLTTEIASIGVVTYSAHQPTVATGSTINIGTLAFGANAPTGGPVLTILSGSTVTPKTALTLTGSPTVTINGPGGLNLSGNSVISSGQSLLAETELTITLNSGTSVITVNSGGAFTLGSDVNGSAAIAAIPNGSAVNGTVEVDRYVHGGSSYYRSYRYFSSPVHLATQVNGMNVVSLNYLASGTWTSGYTGTSGGFHLSPNPTIYLWKEKQPNCQSSYTCGNNRGVDYLNGVPNYYFDQENPAVADGYYGNSYAFTIPVGNGYICYFDGAANDNTTSTFKPTGILNQGSIPVMIWYNTNAVDGNNGSFYNTYNLDYDNPSPSIGNSVGLNQVGNPYPCTIDLNTYSSTISSAGIYAPNTSGSFTENVGFGQSYGNYMLSMGIGMGTNNAGRYIQSGAAFYITANNGSATLTFNESAKAPATQISGTAGTGVVMAVLPSQQTDIQYLRLEMNSDTIHKEDILVWFDKSGKVGFDPMEDGIYMRGYNTVSLSSLSSDGVPLGINKQPLPVNERRIIGLKVDVTNNGTYHFNLRELVGLPQLYDVFLFDAYKKDSVNLRTTAIYNFNIDKSDTNSFGSKRFSLLIKQNPTYAYSLLDFSANKVAQTTRQVQVSWKTQYEGNYTNFTVERSIDGGKTFSALSSVNSATLGQYSFVDNSPIVGLNFYRLKQVDVNNVITYSKTAIIGYDNVNDQSNGPKLTIFPNPASDQISLVILPATTDAAIYKVSISSISGTVLKQMTLSQTTWQGSVSDLQHGVYYIRVLDNKTQKLIVEGKFSKL